MVCGDLNTFRAIKYKIKDTRWSLTFLYVTFPDTSIYLKSARENSLNYNLFLEMMHLIYEFFSGIKRSGRENRWEPELDLYKSTC